MTKLRPENVQNKLHRVVEVYAPDPQEPNAGTLGSGFAVTDDLVLTAKHVVQNAKQVRVRGLGEEWPSYRSAEVVWHSEVWDAALVRLADAPWRAAPDRVRWVHPSGQTSILWVAYGFPRATQFPSGLGRELEAVKGNFIPGAGLKQGTLSLNVVGSALPSSTAEHSSPWQGLSGAAVLTEQGRQLIGLIVHDPPGFGTSRLQGIPVEHLVRDPEFAQLVGVQTTEPARIPGKHAPPREASWERQIALNAIEADTEALLNRLLLGEESIPLGLSNPDGISDPRRPDLQSATQTISSPSLDAPIMQWYTRAKGNLLILSEAGGGKTVTLLQLLRSLLRHAKEDIRAPLPVLVTLSSWDVQKQSFAVWLRQELWRYYQVSPKIGQRWVENDDADTDKLILLLDGLDEVAYTQQQACLDGIERYLKEHMRNIIICCRDADYDQLTKRLKRRTILPKRKVLIHPLTAEQIDAYLVRGGEQLTAVRTALATDPVLAQIVTTPLMLSILCRTYRGKPLDEGVLRGSVQERRAHLFAAYVERMLERERLPERTLTPLYTSEQMTRWLAWLAQQLMQRHQTAFYREWVQHDWLPTERAQKIYSFTMKTLSAIPIGIGLTLLLFGILDFFGGHMGFSLSPLWMLPVGALIILLIWLITRPDRNLYYTIYKRQLETLPTGVLYVLWKDTLQKFLSSLVLGFTPSIMVWFKTHSWQQSAFALSGSVVVAFAIRMVPGKAINIENLPMPNQAIRSTRNSCLLGLLGGLVFGLLFGLAFSLAAGQGVLLIFTIGAAIMWGDLGSTSAGGGLYLEHLVTYIILWKTGFAPPPWQYTSFLNYATDRILLYRRGGSYLFVHRFLLEYFATLNQGPQNENEVEPVHAASNLPQQQRKRARRKRRKASPRRTK